MHSAVGALVAFTAGKESPLPQNKKANKRQDSSLSKVISKLLYALIPLVCYMQWNLSYPAGFLVNRTTEMTALLE